MKGGVILALILVGLTPILIVTLVIVGVATNPVRWEPPNLWSTVFGTVGFNIGDRATSVSADPNGLYVGGYLDQPFEGGPAQLFISRYDLSHQQSWSQLFGNVTEFNVIDGIVGVSDGVYVAGQLNASGFVRKYDLQGNGVWTDYLTSYGSSVNSVSADSANVYALGDYYRNSTNNNGTIALRGYDSSGSVLWTRTVGGGLNKVTDAFRPYVFVSVNGVYVSGFSNPSFPAAGVGYLQRYDSNGTLLWNRQFTCVCAPTGLSSDGTGVYVAGRYSDMVEAFLVKYDLNGNQVWMRLFRPANTAVISLSLSADSSGVYLAYTASNGSFYVSYLSKYDSNGNNVWSFQIPVTPYAVSVGAGSVYVGGSTAPVRVSQAALSEFSQSSSLIFFGLNPPFSFLAVSLLTAAVATGGLWLRKRSRTRAGNYPHRVNS